MSKNRKSRNAGRKKPKNVTSGTGKIHARVSAPPAPKSATSSGGLSGMFKRTVARIRDIEKQAMSKLRGKRGGK